MKNEKLQRVEELRNIMLGLEMNLKILDDDLYEINKNLVYLNRIEEDLVYNINLHKSGRVITVVNEYKRSIDELKIIKKEISKFRSFRSQTEDKLKIKSETYDYYLDEYEKAYEDLNSEHVVLLFRRGKK